MEESYVDLGAIRSTTSRLRSPDMPRLNIVVIGFGSRGDLETTLEIAKVLQFQHGHRVRYVTHQKYQAIVQAAGIEFYSSGRADPPRMIARRNLNREELRKEMPIIQDEFLEMGERYWGACLDDPAGIPEGTSPEPFVADAIIATMMGFAHSFISARMAIPLHLQANNPRIFSRYLPHSQAETAATSSSVLRNVFSWWMKDLFFLDFMNSRYDKLRIQDMGLESFSPLWWTSQFTRLRIPCTNLWSPHLLPNPPDWGKEIDTAGFVFPEHEPYDPPADLANFLEQGEPPIYVGFGSMCFLNPERTIKAILSGIIATGRRIIFAKGWSGVEVDDSYGQNVFVVDEIPHHWLFPRVSAVVIHMGAGTLSAALKAGKPIVMVPVAGDQPFWSHRVFQAGCGPKPIPIKEVTAELVAERVEEAFSPEIARNVQLMAEHISSEEPGQFTFARSALRTFHQVYADIGRCDILPDCVAVWKHSGSGVKLSAVAASILISNHEIQQTGLNLIRHLERPDLKAPGDPITGMIGGLKLVVSRFLDGIKSIVGSQNPQTISQRAWSVPKLAIDTFMAPLRLLQALSYGMYNLVDYLTFKLGSVAQPQAFDSNLWAYSYWNMLRLLFQVPLKEISFNDNSFFPVLLSPVRVMLATINIPVGALAFTTRIINRQFDQSIGVRTTGDVLHNARVRQGRLEMKAASEELHQKVIEGWKHSSTLAQ